MVCSRICSFRDWLFLAGFLLRRQVVDSCSAVAVALGFAGGRLPQDVTLSLHACDSSGCVHRAEDSTHIKTYNVLSDDELNEYRTSWTRNSPSQIVLKVLLREFAVSVPADLCGIELLDMFRDSTTGNLFHYPPKPGAVHRKDQVDSHHSIDPELWRCAFYVSQILWQRCATLCFDGQLPLTFPGFRSQYLPDPSWIPGRTNTIWSSGAFGQKTTKALLQNGLDGVDEAQHKVHDVTLLARSLIQFLKAKAQSIDKNMFGWTGFWLTEAQRDRVACEVAKVVFDNLGRLTFAEQSS